MIARNPATPDAASSEATSSDAADRRRLERRQDVLLAELTLPELRRMLVTAAVGTVVAVLFLWMVRAVLIAGVLGAVAATILRPIYQSLLRGVRSRTAAGILTIVVVFVPIVAALAYGYGQAVGVAAYVHEHQGEVTARVSAALARAGIASRGLTADDARRWVFAAGAFGAALPGAVRAEIAQSAVAATVFIFTLMYALTDSAHALAYVRGRISPRHQALADALEGNVRGVVAGAVYGSVLAQALKSVVIVALALVFHVPLAAALAIVSFILGFFPVVGSWTVYLPMAAWLYVFRGSAWSALLVVAIGFAVNTMFISTYLRPKLAARRSRVLDFYWMFVGLVTGVYAFGLPGLVLGPALIALLKAVVDTVTDPSPNRAEPDAAAVVGT